MDVAAVEQALISRGALDLSGLSSRRIDRAVQSGELHRVQRGWYVPSDVWRAGYAEDRHLIRVVAAFFSMRGTAAVFSWVSAAVLWGLPLFRLRPKYVHLSGIHVHGRAKGGPNVARHETEVPDSDRTVIDGIPCTTLARTVADVIRFAPEVSGIALADAALRQIAWDDDEHEYDEEAAAAFRADVEEHLHVHRGARGVRLARRVIAFADGRAQLPGESASRAYLRDLGFRGLLLQVPVPGPDGTTFWVDVGLEDVPAWYEFDGESKYTDPELRGDRDVAAVLLAEKQREDWIRGTTNRKFARATFEHLVSASTLGARLASFSILPPQAA